MVTAVTAAATVVIVVVTVDCGLWFCGLWSRNGGVSFPNGNSSVLLLTLVLNSLNSLNGGGGGGRSGRSDRSSVKR